jgi:coupling of ubiquitin conjugation to ER degradation protein 1
MSDTISIPSILLAGAIIFIIVRFVFYPSRNPREGRTSAGFPGARRVDITKVEQVASMFPQLDRRAIAWDLSRNGGNVSATTERVLSGQGLDNVSSIDPSAFKDLLRFIK